MKLPNLDFVESKNNILVESMTRVVVGNLVIRVWRQEENGDIETSQKEVRELVLNYVMNNSMFSFYSMAKSLIDLIPRINAIEILDKDGNGIIIYESWP